ncbi:MAG: GlsB/YeaQ/YmgE family stress response membrane protein [Propionibacteriaceae bacterium]|nr:GlsB/YeaQ/YmgE family stress response membrane protein [Propionibacteriaceae bacterium]
MGIIGYLVIGAIVGSIARVLLPGRINGGFITSMTFGVAGALVGGLLAEKFFKISMGTFFDIRSWLISLGGAVIVIVVWGFITGRNKKAS